MELQTKQLVLAVKQIAEEKNLPEDVVQDVIEQAMAAAYRKDFGDKEQSVRSSIDLKSGDLTIFIEKEVVEEVEDEHTQMTLKEAKAIKKDAEIGGTVDIIAKPETFGRVAAQTAKQVILQKLRENEREIVLNEYQDKIGEVLNGVVQRVEAKLVRVDLGKATGIMPGSEQIQGEYYSPGARIKVFLKDVERTNRGPQLILSRANTQFIEYLFKNEVPEMENGAVEIKAIAREAGVRTKIAVASSVPGVDPVGTFVGGHGTRVQAVMSEIGDKEKIDIINFEDNQENFIKAALSPTEIESVDIDEAKKKAKVNVREDQLSVAIGKGGQNVRLASKLVGYEIDIEKYEEPKKEKPKKAAGNYKRKDELESNLLSAIDQHGEDNENESAESDQQNTDKKSE